MSTTLTVENLPEDLHSWLEERALANRHSVDAEVIALLASLRRPKQVQNPSAKEAALEVIARCVALPTLDSRGSEEILGYDESGVPH